jgi:hypothetical protein
VASISEADLSISSRGGGISIGRAKCMTATISSLGGSGPPGAGAIQVGGDGAGYPYECTGCG